MSALLCSSLHVITALTLFQRLFLCWFRNMNLIYSHVEICSCLIHTVCSFWPSCNLATGQGCFLKLICVLSLYRCVIFWSCTALVRQMKCHYYQYSILVGFVQGEIAIWGNFNHRRLSISVTIWPSKTMQRVTLSHLWLILLLFHFNLKSFVLHQGLRMKHQDLFPCAMY